MRSGSGVVARPLALLQETLALLCVFDDIFDFCAATVDLALTLSKEVWLRLVKLFLTQDIGVHFAIASKFRLFVGLSSDLLCSLSTICFL